MTEHYNFAMVGILYQQVITYFTIYMNYIMNYSMSCDVGTLYYKLTDLRVHSTGQPS